MFKQEKKKDKEVKSKMADEKETQSTCFENMPFAEMIRKMVGQKGVGSLCKEMMKKIIEQQEDGYNLHCTEMMQKMMKECSKVKEEPEKPK
jgi:hypothetical protein